MSFVDTHCHLFFDSYKEDLSQVLERAKRVEIDRIVIPAIDIKSSEKTIQLCDQHPSLFAAVGIHPTNADTWNENTRKYLFDLAQHPKVVAIGEIGLDYYRDFATPAVQRLIFQEQLELASELALPVIIHSRKAIEEVWDFLSNWCQLLAYNNLPLVKFPGVMHSFEGDVVMANQFVKSGFFIGIGGPVTFRNAGQIHDVCKALPIDNLLLETDSPFLTPHPYRGERNEPARLRQIAEKVAELRLIPLSVVEQLTTQNASNLFAWKDLN